MCGRSTVPHRWAAGCHIDSHPPTSWGTRGVSGCRSGSGDQGNWFEAFSLNWTTVLDPTRKLASNRSMGRNCRSTLKFSGRRRRSAGIPGLAFFLKKMLKGIFRAFPPPLGESRNSRQQRQIKENRLIPIFRCMPETDNDSSSWRISHSEPAL